MYECWEKHIKNNCFLVAEPLRVGYPPLDLSGSYFRYYFPLMNLKNKLLVVWGVSESVSQLVSESVSQ